MTFCEFFNTVPVDANMKPSLLQIHSIVGNLVDTLASGPNGEGFFRLSVFGHRENMVEAVEKIKKNLKRVI